MKTTYATALGALVLAASAQADSIIQITPPGTPMASEKVALVVGPEALRLARASQKAGSDNWVTIDLDVGVFTGIRAAILPYKSDDLIVAVEGFYGGAVLSQAYGGGVRVQFRVASSAKNALLISPGLDVYVSPPDSSFFGHSGTQIYAVADADISWLHEFASHFGFELGLRLGGGIWTNTTESGIHPIPEVELFTGFRF